MPVPHTGGNDLTRSIPLQASDRVQSRYGDLLDAATKLFSEHGYERTTVRMIANEMGVQSGSLYSHIKSKEEVLRRIVIACAESLMVRVEDARDRSETPEERLRAMCRAHMRVQQEEKAAVTIYFDEWHKLDEESREYIVELRRRYEQELAEVVEEGIERGDFGPVDVRGAVLVILSALNWAYTWYRPDGRLSPEEIADLFVDVIVEGLRRRD
ncbi:MAG: TetR family transcriptional regulator [Streptosporangiales bacterium]|nr:TetR family transcriptional regulator [Streptosporangiales bacterium]